jgi:hypothetical protein
MIMDYIYQNNNSLCSELCKEIIEIFENDKNKHDGLTIGGINKKVKDTMDLNIYKTDNKWSEVCNFLETELTYNLKIYSENINKKYKNVDGFDKSYEVLNKNIEITPFMVQRYIKNEGKYIYHNDFNIDYKKKSYRVLTYLFYLNDIDEGGETEFFGGDIKIIPKAGKLIIFPASWTFPHCGKMPISSNKYIITGWIYNSM